MKLLNGLKYSLHIGLVGMQLAASPVVAQTPPQSTARSAAPQLTAQPNPLNELRETIRSLFNGELAAYMSGEGKAELEKAIIKWEANRPANELIVDRMQLRQGFAEKEAYRLLVRKFPQILSGIEQKIAGYKRSNAAPVVVQAAEKFIAELKSPVYQAAQALQHQQEWARSTIAGRNSGKALQPTSNPDANKADAAALQTDPSLDSNEVLRIPFVIQKDENVELDPAEAKLNDFFIGQLEADLAPRSSLEHDKPSALRKNAAKLAHFGKDFAVQSTLFNIPIGFIMIAQLGIDYSKDPLAFERFVHSLKDPAVHAGFAAFMATNHKVTHLMSGIMSGKISRHLLPYIGMSAGLIASSVVHEMWVDKDVWKCVKSPITNIKACDVAFERWVTLNKINQYAPAIVSLSLSTLGATGLGVFVMKPAGKLIKVAFKGLRVARLGATVGGGAAGLVTNFVFVATDTVVANYVQPWMQKLATEQMDIADFLRRYALLGTVANAGRMIFRGTIKLPEIDKVSTLKQARSILKDTVARADAGKWQEPQLENCLKGYKNPASVLLFMEDIRACIFTSDAAASVELYGKVSKAWREALLAKPLMAESAWREALFNFSAVYIASNAVYKYVIESLHAQARGQLTYNGAPIDLSLPALNKVLTSAVNIKPVKQRNEEEAEALKGLHPDRVGMTATPELLDYIVAGMACHPRVDDGTSVSQYISSLSFVPYVFGNVPRPLSPIVQAPVGGKPQFLPPNITTHDGDICDVGPRKIKMHPGMTREQMKNYDEQNSVPVLQAEWFDGQDGKTYKGLMSFVEAKINPDLVRADQSTSEFNIWWDEKVTPVAADVWLSFGIEYQQFLKNNLYPTLTRRDTRAYSTCLGAEENTDSMDPSDSISCGVYHSMEIELRQYLSVLRALYLSSHPPVSKARAKADTDFLNAARPIVEAFRGKTTPEFVEDSFENPTVLGPLEKMAALLDGSLNAETDKYKLRTAGSIITQVQNILEERAGYKKMLTVLNFDEQDVSSGPVKSKGNDIRTRGAGGH